jgi:hypothetical protein
MLAVVHAANVPEPPCQFDNERTVCPENWEMRQLYIVSDQFAKAFQFRFAN